MKQEFNHISSIFASIVNLFTGRRAREVQKPKFHKIAYQANTPSAPFGFEILRQSHGGNIADRESFRTRSQRKRRKNFRRLLAAGGVK